LPRYRILDPRPEPIARECPILESVNIPLNELRQAAAELPPPTDAILLPEVPESAAATAILEAMGRRVTQVRTVFGASPRGRLWEPNGLLPAWISARSPGTAIDLGAGGGRDSVYLAAHGWDVVAIDRATGFEEILRRVERRSLGIEGGIRCHFGDMSAVAQYAPADLLLMSRVLDRSIVVGASRWLRPGGALLMQCFHPEERELRGHPRSAGLVATPEELMDLLGEGLRAVLAERHEGEGRVWTRLIAQQA
jgi:SAM-dependent methyltransferase